LIFLYILISDESRIIFLPERSSICQYRPKISAIIAEKQSRTRLLFAHPVAVLYILKTQKCCLLYILKTTVSKPNKKRYKLRLATFTNSESGSGSAT